MTKFTYLIIIHDLCVCLFFVVPSGQLENWGGSQEPGLERNWIGPLSVNCIHIVSVNSLSNLMQKE